MRSDWGVVFKYGNCVEEEISRFSNSKSGHIRWQIFTKSVEFAKVNAVKKLISYYRNKFLSHKRASRAGCRLPPSDRKSMHYYYDFY